MEKVIPLISFDSRSIEKRVCVKWSKKELK